MMDQNNAFDSSSEEIKELGGKSWTAYIKGGLIALALLFIAVPLAWSASWVVGLLALVVSIFFVAYNVLVIRSYKFYCDDVGVWVYAGVLPWSRSITGVKWRDLDEAVYFPTFWSWLFRSYSIRIGHRFTKSSEIFLTHMAKGDVSVVEINSQHQDRIRANALV